MGWLLQLRADDEAGEVLPGRVIELPSSGDHGELGLVALLVYLVHRSCSPVPLRPLDGELVRLAVSLRVLDAVGRVICTLLDGTTMDAGMHTVEFSGTGLPSGPYFAELKTSGETLKKQMSLTK